MKTENANVFPLHDDHDLPGGSQGAVQTADSMADLLAQSGYSAQAIDYYMNKPHLGAIPDANIVAEYTGSCGDRMILYLKVSAGQVLDAKFQVTGCAGALTAAMAAVDLIKGKNISFAASIDDGMVFGILEQMPPEKHECIQLAVKTVQKAFKDRKYPEIKGDLQMYKEVNHNGSMKKKSKGPSSAFLHDPKKVLENIPLKNGQVFVDLGCGAGDYTVAASSMVGEKGQVYALDKEKYLVDQLATRAKQKSLHNVSPLTADILSSLPFEDKSVDVVFITTVLHIFNLNKIASSLFPEIRRILRPGGVLTIVEVKKEDRNFGPPKEMCHSPEEIQAAVEPHSFILKNRTFFDYTYLIQFN